MANLVDSRSWWKARRGFGEIGASANIIGPPGYTSPFTLVAKRGDLVYNSRPNLTVRYGTDGSYSREFPIGAMRCTPENFGAPSNWVRDCYVADDDIRAYLETRPTMATKVAAEGQAFRLDTPGHVYFVNAEASRIDANTVSQVGVGIRQWVNTGTKECTRQNFGPAPNYASRKECWFVPSPGEDVVEAGAPITYYEEQAAQYEMMQRAETARIAAEMMQAAQDRVFTERQAADYAAQQAMMAQDAQAQAAAALAAAESYRQIQQEAHRQAAEYAAELAALAAAGAADVDAARAAAETAAEAEGIRRALAEARAHEAEIQAAYDAALAATQAEMRNQEVANARLDAAENAADQAAANAAAGGIPGGVMGSDLLLYGGLAAVAALLVLAD